jgi:predicted nucleic acid-binding protein
LRLYLDLNCFNRPFDDQTQDRVARETEATLSILQRVIDGVDELVWSAVLDFENSQHPLVDRRNEIARWAIFATARVAIDPRITSRAQEIETAGLRPLDAAHLACAEAAVCDRFLTCDDQLTRKARAVKMALVVQSPTEYIAEQTHA